MVVIWLWELLNQTSTSESVCITYRNTLIIHTQYLNNSLGHAIHRFCLIVAVNNIHYSPLLEGLGLNEDDLPGQMDIQKWVCSCVAIFCSKNNLGKT